MPPPMPTAVATDAATDAATSPTAVATDAATDAIISPTHDSMLFVAMITLTSPRSSNPSSWFSSSSMVRWISRVPPDCES